VTLSRTNIYIPAALMSHRPLGSYSRQRQQMIMIRHSTWATWMHVKIQHPEPCPRTSLLSAIEGSLHPPCTLKKNILPQVVTREAPPQSHVARCKMKLNWSSHYYYMAVPHAGQQDVCLEPHHRLTHLRCRSNSHRTNLCRIDPPTAKKGAGRTLALTLNGENSLCDLISVCA
jgi:hypothetical protein